MEALVALGVACNILQVASFCHETVSTSVRIYKKGSSDPELAHDVSKIKGLAEQLESAVSYSATVMTTASPAHTELIEIAHDCASTAKDLELELSQIASSQVGAVGRAFKIRLRKSHLEGLEQRLM